MESTPLLENARPNEAERGTAANLEALKQHVARWHTLYVCVLFLIVTDVSSFMGEGPMLRMLELGACREYYTAHEPDKIDDHGNVPERLCKVADIQSRVAHIRGLLSFMEAVPGLVLAVPYGIIADAYGRTLVIGLCLVGFLIRDTWIFVCLYFHRLFPLNAVYFAPLTAIIGGGSTVTSPMLFAIVAASTPQERRAHAFFLIQVCLLSLESISPPLGSLLMETIGPYYAWLVGIPLGLLGFFCLPLLQRNKTQVEPFIPEAVEQEAPPTTTCGSIQHSITELVHYFKVDMPKLFHNKSLFIGLLAMFIAKIARPVKDLLSQFMTVKFKWPISQANLLISLHAAAQLPWFIAVLPAANALLLRSNGNAVRANHTLAIALVCCLTLGALLMGSAPTSVTFIFAVIVYTCGSGFSVAMRSLLTALVADDQLSLLFTSMAVFEAAALLTAAPTLQLLFARGLQYGGVMMSLPFFVVGILYGCAALTLCFCTF